MLTILPRWTYCSSSENDRRTSSTWACRVATKQVSRAGCRPSPAALLMRVRLRRWQQATIGRAALPCETAVAARGSVRGFRSALDSPRRLSDTRPSKVRFRRNLARYRRPAPRRKCHGPPRGGGGGPEDDRAGSENNLPVTPHLIAALGRKQNAIDDVDHAIGLEHVLNGDG